MTVGDFQHCWAAQTLANPNLVEDFLILVQNYVKALGEQQSFSRQAAHTSEHHHNAAAPSTHAGRLSSEGAVGWFLYLVLVVYVVYLNPLVLTDSQELSYFFEACGLLIYKPVKLIVLHIEK